MPSSTKLETIYPALGTRLYDRRTHLGLTQAEVARCIGVTQATVSTIEKGVTRIPLCLLTRWAKVLRVLPSALIKGLS